MMKKFRSKYLVQCLAALGTNPFLGNFFTGEISKGSGKFLCVPGLNCYSCPAAAFSCPIGSLQAVIGGIDHKVSYYVVGILIFFGTIFGRLICGLLCPFGFLQDLLYKIPVKKRELPEKTSKILRKAKYGFLLIFVIAMPLLLTNEFGIGAPAFCKYICPAGILEGGIPLLIKNESLRNSLGFLFSWKFALAMVIVAASTVIYRPFCKYICPLGAFYSLFNKISFVKLSVNEDRCIGCGKCKAACKMGVNVLKENNSTECIRCGDCAHVCPVQAISIGISENHGEKNLAIDREK